MTKFTTRVELHDADSDDYTKLHKEMKKEGFSRSITSSDGIEYELPPGEYDYNGDVARGDVLNKAKRAASAVQEAYAVLVTESAGRTWQALKAV